MNTLGVYDLLKEADLQTHSYGRVRTREIYAEAISIHAYRKYVCLVISVSLGPSTLWIYSDTR